MFEVVYFTQHSTLIDGKGEIDCPEDIYARIQLNFLSNSSFAYSRY